MSDTLEILGKRKRVTQIFVEEIRTILAIGLPAALSVSCAVSVSLITLAYVGRLGELYTAVAGLGVQLTMVSGLGMVVFAAADAVSTFVAQAHGAGDDHQIPSIVWRGIFFNTLHSIPLITLLLLSPTIFRRLGRPAEFTNLLFPYLALLAPSIPIYGVYFPLNNALLALGESVPQLAINAVSIPVHVSLNHLFIYKLNMGYLGAGLAITTTTLLICVLLIGYIWASGKRAVMLACVAPAAVFAGFAKFSRLAYFSIINRGIEFYSYTAMTVLAGFLPRADASQAAMSVSFDVLTLMLVQFQAVAIAVTARTGYLLGSGDWKSAQISLLSGLCVHPVLWAGMAGVMFTQSARDFVIGLFLKGGSDEVWGIMRKLLVLCTIHEVSDGAQMILVGGLTGAGLQGLAVPVNIVAFLGVGVPLMVYLGFYTPLGTTGLLMGVMVSPVIQAVSFAVKLWNVDWTGVVRDVQFGLPSARSCSFNRPFVSQSISDVSARRTSNESLVEPLRPSY